MDRDLARKGHIANVLYSLFRTMTLTAFILTLLSFVSFFLDTSTMGTVPKVVLIVVFFQHQYCSYLEQEVKVRGMCKEYCLP